MKKFVLQRPAAGGSFVPPIKVTRNVGIQVNDGKGVAIVKVEVILFIKCDFLKYIFTIFTLIEK